MEVIRGLYNIKSRHQHCAISIGNFDGMHLGHQHVISTLIKAAEQQQCPSMVMLFEPQPNEYFSHYKTPRLMRLREKILHLQRLGVDYVLCLRFDEALAALSANEFITEILVKKLAIHSILVGDDFHFGYKRQGDIKLLKEFGAQFNYTANCLSTFKADQERVSSTLIRHLLAQGDMQQVAALLKRPFAMMGRVAHGDKRGRLLGFPTANIHLHRKNVPLSGVFVVTVSGVGNTPLQGVANIGTRPTVKGDMKTLLEVHLFDFDQDIYGKWVEVQILRKLRDEQKFPDLQSLINQIHQDVQDAHSFFQ